MLIDNKIRCLFEIGNDLQDIVRATNNDVKKILNDFKAYLYELNINAKIEKNDELIFSENIIKNEINKELQQTLNNSDINFKLKYLLSAVLIIELFFKYGFTSKFLIYAGFLK